jgi:hypothetical protein
LECITIRPFKDGEADQDHSKEGVWLGNNYTWDHSFGLNERSDTETINILFEKATTLSQKNNSCSL